MGRNRWRLSTDDGTFPSRHGFDLPGQGIEGLVLHLFPPTSARPESLGGCVIEVPVHKGKVSVEPQ